MPADEDDSTAPLASFVIDFSSDEYTEEYGRNLRDIREENFLTESVGLENYEDMAEQLDEERIDIENSYFGRIMTRSTLRIPKYQRNYSWTEENHEQLWYDLRDTLLLLNDEDEDDSYLRESFFGALCFVESRDSVAITV
jgi:hypothetical protein